MSRFLLMLGLGASLLLSGQALAGGALKARGALVRPADGPEADAKGAVQIRTKLKQGQHEFEIHAKRLAPGVDHDVYLETGRGSGLFVLVQTVATAANGRLDLELHTGQGDPLPLDAADAQSLEGFALQLRVADEVRLYGVVPDFSASAKAVLAKQDYEPADSGDAETKTRLKLRSKASKGDERFDLLTSQLEFPEGRSYALFVETALGSGVLDDVGVLQRLGSSSKARIRCRTKDGEALPHQKLRVRELVGRRFEIRDEQGGVHVEGEFPSLGK